jgi:hypothetical protein
MRRIAYDRLPAGAPDPAPKSITPGQSRNNRLILWESKTTAR